MKKHYTNLNPKGSYIYSNQIIGNGATPSGSYVPLTLCFYKHVNPSDLFN